MLSTPKAKGGLFLASSLCDGLEDNNMRQVAMLLLNKDADPNILIPTHGVTPFHLVIGNDSEEFAEEVTKLFLRHGGNPNVRSSDGMTPVHVAAAWGRANILELLLANGGDPLRLDNDGRSPFHYAFDGKFFKVMTLLSKYCENIQDKDDKPKYNMVLDKVLISNRDVIAEYVASKTTAVDVDNVTKKIVPIDLYNCKSNSSSMNAVLGSTTNVCDSIETEYKLSRDVDKSFLKSSNVTSIQPLNNLSQTDEKETSNYSFIDLDFDFAHLRLADVVQKEKSFVSQIINHLSTSLSNDYSIHETLHNKEVKQEESSVATTESDISLQPKKDSSFHKRVYYKNSKRNFSPKLTNNGSPVKKWSTYDTRSACKKKSKRILDEMPVHILDNSIVSMSPNFNTPNHKKRRNVIKTPLTPLHIFNDPIISKSPNFATPVCPYRKKSRAKPSRIDDYFSSNVSKRSYEYENQYVGFDQYKKNIAQSTPRRKKRSIYKLSSARKRFEPYWFKNNIISDEFTTSNRLKPVNLNKTIFSAEDISCHDTADSCNESTYFKEHSHTKQHNYSNQSTMQFDEENLYNEDSIIYNNLNCADKIESSNCDQTEKENEFANSFGDDKKYIKSDNNQVNTAFITIRRDIFKTDKASGTINTSATNVKSKCTTDSSQRENAENCIDCGTKKLLNEDLNMNISKTCKHERNWYDDKFHDNLSNKFTTVNDSLLTINLPGRTENLSEAKDPNLCKSEKSSSLLSYISAQEYKYEDPEEGVILLERRVCVTPFGTFGDNECDIKSEMTTYSASVCENLPKEILVIDDATLRRELQQLGTEPGPITSTTRHVYLKRLLHLKNIQDNKLPSSISRNLAVPSNQIKPHLQFGDWLNHLDTYKSLEKEVFQAFASPDPTRRWREGTSKASFTYLLLDPRVTQDLPNRCVDLTESETWSIFLNAIFYIGKGKRSRPFAHLYDAFNTWVGKSSSTNKKINRILDIWNSDHGVICLHVFQNVIPVEAYTREAVMIEAIGKEQLENCKTGEYYGIVATWSIPQKQKFGRFLLYKALQILMHEGESQLFPCNL